MTDVCILCETPPPPALTPEHVWPEWYSRSLPRGTKLEFTGKMGGNAFTWPAQRLNLKLRCLCQPCNGEWGSNLENEVRAFLLPMSRWSSPTILSWAQMRLLAAWVSLKLMVIDAMRPEQERIFTQENRSFLRERKVPARDSTALWIGKYTGRFALAGRFDENRSVLHHPEDVSDEYESWVTAFSIGHVVIQSWVLPRAGELADRPNIQLWQSPYDWSKAMSQFWPTPEHPIQWPPSYVVSEQSWPMLTTRWHS